MTKGGKASVQVINDHGPAGFVMFVAFVGALVYFSQQAHDLLGFLFAFLEALVWPGILLYHVLQVLRA